MAIAARREVTGTMSHGDDLPELEALGALIEHRCALCQFYARENGASQGECHALPPVPQVIVVPGGPAGVLAPGGPAFAARPQLNFVSKWPDVQGALGWCGYFRPTPAALAEAREFEDRVRRQGGGS